MRTDFTWWQNILIIVIPFGVGGALALLVASFTFLTVASLLQALAFDFCHWLGYPVDFY